MVPGLDGALVLDLGKNTPELGLHAGIRGGQPAELAQGGQTLVAAVDESQPAGRVGEEVDAGAQEGGADHLQAEGQAEGDLADHVAGAKGDPEGDHDAGDDGDGLEDEEGAAKVGWGDFGNVQWCCLR